jgi:hypothetical protein
MRKIAREQSLRVSVIELSRTVPFSGPSPLFFVLFEAAWTYSDGNDRLSAMRPVRAVVRKGQLTVDEPTDLPEGEVVELVSMDDVLAGGGDGLDDGERERLHESLERGLADVRAGRTVDARQMIAGLRAKTPEG